MGLTGGAHYKISLSVVKVKKNGGLSEVYVFDQLDEACSKTILLENHPLGPGLNERFRIRVRAKYPPSSKKS